MVDDPSTELVEQDETGVRELALATIKKRRDFAAHVVTYVVVNAAVWVIWATTGAGYAWPAWISGAWAIGLILNAWDLYGRRPITEDDVRREMDKLRPAH